MDSPESSQPTAIAAETAAIAQDSPVFSFISNLSPIQPVKAPSVRQDFVEVNSPPLVFKSPRLNPRSQLMSLKRSQFPRQILSELPGQDEHGMNSVPTTKLYEKPDIQLCTNEEEDSDRNRPVNDLETSAIGSSEQFLRDTVIMDSVGSEFSLDSTMRKSECIDQPLNAVVKLDSELNSRISEEVGLVPPFISRQSEEVHKENIPVDARGTEIDKTQGDGDYVDHYPQIGHELPLDNALTNRDKENSVTENVEAGQVALLDPSSYLLSGPTEIGKENESFVDANGAALNEPFLEKVQNDPEVFQHGGTRRRCLQFQDSQYKAILNQSAEIPSNCDGTKPLSQETPSMPINGKRDEVTQPVRYPKNYSNSTINIPKPSGIGLHLNSIVSTVQPGSGAIVNVKSAHGNLSVTGKKSTLTINPRLSEYSNSSSVLSVVENNALENTDDNMHEIQDSAVAMTSMPSSNHIVQPSNNTVVLNSVGDQSTPGNKRNYTEKDDGSDDFNYKSSPKNKRMKSSDPGNAGGCKNCNCKRNKCLKLYCDCFAAGIYCADSCACQECFNRPEYEDTVLETRQKIESRNPLAFAPKIVQQAIEQPATSHAEEGTNFTPSSARHKRGCNCKKSMCLKKYCVCYQSNVGCSDGCRCEGCKNVFGQKGEYGMVKDVWNEEDTNVTTNGSFLEKREIEPSGNGAHREEFFNLHNLSPITPAFDFSNHGKDASKAWCHSGKYFESPEPGYTFVAPYMMSSESSRSSDNHVLNSETGDGILDRVSFEQSHRGNSEMVDELLSAEYHHPGTMGRLSSTPNLQNWADNSKSQPFPAQRHSSGSSLVWGGSPQTPMAQFSGTKMHRELQFDSGLSSIAEDDRPEILKDNSTPLDAVKVSSPNKKRVSPPHGRQNEFGSSSSAGLRSGRKFILKAITPFPPLTPCVDSETVTTQHKIDPQNRNVHK
ncbi:hypothetical protein ACP275_05G130400 [Erythranthe tilingii]